jgi:hypothetical protein
VVTNQVSTRADTLTKAVLRDLPGEAKAVPMFEAQHRDTWRTYRLPIDLVARIDATAAAKRVYKSSLVAFLLAKALDQVDVGELVIRTRPSDWPRLIVHE